MRLKHYVVSWERERTAHREGGEEEEEEGARKENQRNSPSLCLFSWKPKLQVKGKCALSKSHIHMYSSVQAIAKQNQNQNHGKSWLNEISLQSFPFSRLLLVFYLYLYVFLFNSLSPHTTQHITAHHNTLNTPPALIERMIFKKLLLIVVIIINTIVYKHSNSIQQPTPTDEKCKRLIKSCESLSVSGSRLGSDPGFMVVVKLNQELLLSKYYAWFNKTTSGKLWNFHGFELRSTNYKIMNYQKQKDFYFALENEMEENKFLKFDCQEEKNGATLFIIFYYSSKYSQIHIIYFLQWI